MKLRILFLAIILLNFQVLLAAAGDDCSTSILVSSNGCSSSGQYTNSGITGTLTAPSCFSTGTNNGMWFSFLASGPVVTIDVNASTLSVAQFALLTNATGCTGTFTEIACVKGTTATTSLTYSNLTSGTKYYIYVDGVNNNVGTFQLCLTSPSQPSNDQVCNAITLQANNFCSPADGYSNVGATTESLMATIPGCLSATDEINSVYFKFTAIGTSNTIIVNGSSSGLSRPQFLVFTLSPDCNASTYSLNGCSVASATSNSTTLNINNLVAGTTYYIMVDGYGTGTGAFQICVNSYAPVSTVQNDDCSTSIVLCPGNRYYSTTKGATPDSNKDPYTNGGGEWNCNGVVDNSVWFTYSTSSTVQDVNFSITSTCVDLGGGSYPDGGFLQFEVFKRVDGLSDCANRSTLGTGTWASLGNCVTVGSGGPSTGVLTIPASAMQANKQYYVVVDNYPSCGCDFDFVINGNAGTDAGANETVCIDDAAYAMTGFTPAGGSWTGPGMSSGGTFDPAVAGIGTHVVYYTTGSCTDSKTITVSGPIVTVSNDLTICPSESVNIIGNIAGTTTYTINESATPAATIPDDGITSTWTGSSGTYATSTITPTGLVAGYTFNSVTINITHDYDGDLIAWLFNPCGGSIKLINGNGGSGNDFTNTVFSKTATSAISSGSAPFTGAFIPAGGAAAWNTFLSCSTVGTFTLKVGDDGYISEGTLQSWSINITNNVTLPTYVWSPTTNMTNSTSLEPTVSPTTTTTYTLTATDYLGCVNSDQVVVNVSSNADATFTMTPTCDGGTASISGTTGGTFTFTTPPSDAAVINASTGTITGGTSGATYDVTYTTPGSCSATSSQTVTASGSDDPTFSMTPTCDGGTATITGTTGGTFTFTTPPSDAAIINASTGAVTGGTSGTTYDVTYTTGGTCSATSNQTVTASGADDPTFSMTATCDGGTATIVGTTGGTFTFTTPPSDAAVINASTGDLTGGTSGTTYAVTYTTGGTCSATSNQTVTASNADDATFSMTATCDGGTATITGTTGGTFTFTTPPSDAAIINASTGAVTGGTSGTTYAVTYTTGGACSATSNQTVTAIVADDATFSLTASCTGATATISGTTGGTFTFTTPPSDAAIINASTGEITGGTPSTLYGVTYTTGGACSTTSNQTVTTTSSDNASFTLTAKCDGALATITGTTGGTFTFTTPPSDAAIINTSTGAVTGGTSGTTYDVTYTTGGACSATYNQTVTATNGDDATFSMTATCDGGTATIAGTTGGTFTFTTPPSDAAIINATTGTVTGGTSGATYDITYSTGGACSASSNQTVTVLTTDDATFSMTATCDGGTATIAGTTGGTFTFTTPPSDAAVINASTGTITNGTSGASYDITYSTGGVCSASSNQTVTVLTTDDATFSMIATCDGGTATISGTTGGTFTFTTPPSDAAIINASIGAVTGGTSGTTYDITYTTSGSCTATSNQTITATNADDPTFSMTATCDGGTATIVGTTGGTFTFTTPPSDAAVINASTGTITNGTSGSSYGVTYTTSGACSATLGQNVTVLTTDDATFSMTATCDGGTATIVGTTGGTFTFTTPPSDAAVINASTGTITNGTSGSSYGVTYTTSGACSATSSQNVTVLTTDDATFSMTATCDGGTATIAGTTGGTFTFTTPPSDAAVINASTGTITNGTSGSSYDISYSTGGVCSASSNHTVTVLTTDDATFSMIATCDGGTATISGTTGGTFTFTTPPSDAAIINASTGTITNGTSGSSYGVTYTTSGACSATSGLNVTVLTTDDATFSITATCDGGTATIVGTTGGTFTFTTPPSDAAVINASTGTITNGTSGSSYGVTYTTSGACSVTSSQNVTVLTTGDATFSMTATCDGGTATIVGTTGGTFTFTTPPSDVAVINSNTGEITGGTSGTQYSVTYTTQGNCPDVSTQTVTSKLLLTPVVTCGNNSKYSLTFNWTAPNGATDYDITYSINGGTPVSGGNVITNSYIVSNLSVDDQVDISIITNGTECYDIATGTCVTQSCTPSVASFLPDPKTITSTSPVTNFVNSSTNSIGYYWDFGDGTTSTANNPTHEYMIDESTVYNVYMIAYNADGCNDTVTQSVIVKEELIYYVPNTFTPDGDEFNNEFYPVFYSGYDPYSYSMYIFDRWGAVVFETHDISKGWKGTYGSTDKLAQDGVYIWKIEFKEKGIDKKVQINGTVVLAR